MKPFLAPLHRLHRFYARSGADIPVSTLSDWTASVGALVEPLVEIGSVWVYIGDDRDVLFRYTPTAEGAPGPWTFLGGRTGYVQADASNVFDRLFNGQAARAIALGRKNYLFSGSHDAARRAAALYSLTRICAQRGVPPLPYLTDVLQKLANSWTVTRLDELLPHRWQLTDPALNNPIHPIRL